MEKSSYNLLNLLLKESLASIKKLWLKEEKLNFPQKIGSYQFDRYFKKTGPRKSYGLAIYKTKNGKKAIAKATSAKNKGYHYYSLLNEITTYKILNQVIERLKPAMSKEYKNIDIPELIEIYDDKNIYCFLIEFMEGKVAENLTAKRKISLFLKTLSFLEYISNNMLQEEKRHFAQRKGYHYIALYPLLAINAIAMYPSNAKTIFLASIKWLTCTRSMYKDSRLSLVHRDLHFMNILLLKKGRIAIIDLQQCVYTEPMVESITILRYWWKGWKTREFGQLLYKEIIKKYKTRKSFERLFQGYAIQSGIHGLTGHFNKKIISGWIDFLTFFITIDTKYYEK